MYYYIPEQAQTDKPTDRWDKRNRHWEREREREREHNLRNKEDKRQIDYTCMSTFINWKYNVLYDFTWKCTKKNDRSRVTPLFLETSKNNELNFQWPDNNQHRTYVFQSTTSRLVASNRWFFISFFSFFSPWLLKSDDQSPTHQLLPQFPAEPARVSPSCDQLQPIGTFLCCSSLLLWQQTVQWSHWHQTLQSRNLSSYQPSSCLPGQSQSPSFIGK